MFLLHNSFDFSCFPVHMRNVVDNFLNQKYLSLNFCAIVWFIYSVFALFNDLLVLGFFHPVFGKCVRLIVNSLVKLFHKFCMLFSFLFFFLKIQVMNLKNITFILLKNQFERQLLFKSSTLIYRYLYNIYKEHNIAVKLYFILKLKSNKYIKTFKY